MKRSFYHLMAIAVTVIISICTTAAKAQSSTGFVTIWKPGQTTGRQNLNLPIIGTKMDIHWEEVGYPLHSGQLLNVDNTSLEVSSGTYLDLGVPHNPSLVNATYKVTIHGMQRFFTYKAIENAPRLMEISNWGNETLFTTFQSAFFNCFNMLLTATDAPVLKNVTSMNGMFSGCYNLRDVKGSMRYWDTMKITDMNNMFFDAVAFNGNINSWNTSNVRYMLNMFSGASVFNGDISKWDVSNVTSMQSMFRGAGKFNQDLSAWNTANVGDMSSMFNDAASFNGNIGSWNTSNAVSMSQMFLNARLFNNNIGNWNTSNVKQMYGMFGGATSFNQDLGNWNTANVRYMYYMFKGASSFNQNIGTWDLSSIAVEGITGILNASGIDCTNYSKTLVGWASSANTPNNIQLGAAGITYSGAEATEARNKLIGSKGWKITGDLYNESTCSGGIAPETFKNAPTAYLTNNMLRVYWETLAGNGTDHFEIEVSKDGETWQKAGENIQGKANGIKAGTVIGYQSQIPFQQVALIAFSVLALGFVTIKKIHKKYRIMLAVLTLATLIYGCSKNNEIVCQQYQDMFVRIKQINIKGNANYSKIVKAKVE